MHKLPNLLYKYDALEPFIDAKTMEIHHSKHHQTYVDKLNEAVKGTQFENMDIKEVLKNLDKVPENIRTKVKNHGGGHYNHSLFWIMMAPTGTKPSETVMKKLNEAFGSLEKFKEQFTNAALNQFGSGWTWLVSDKEKLEIISTSNQDSPISQGKTPILCVDVWEHSYYIKYMWRRADYINAWWNVVNWKQVEENIKNIK